MLETSELAKAEVGGGFGGPAQVNKKYSIDDGSYVPDSSSDVTNEFGRFPNDDEMHTLRRVSGPIPWMAYSVCFVELCERFSYYGMTSCFPAFFFRCRCFVSVPSSRYNQSCGQ